MIVFITYFSLYYLYQTCRLHANTVGLHGNKHSHVMNCGTTTRVFFHSCEFKKKSPVSRSRSSRCRLEHAKAVAHQNPTATPTTVAIHPALNPSRSSLLLSSMPPRSTCSAPPWNRCSSVVGWIVGNWVGTGVGKVDGDAEGATVGLAVGAKVMKAVVSTKAKT